MKKYYLDQILVEQILRKSEERAKASKRNKEVSEKWFTIAENDIKMTEMLYKSGYYAGAVYHLQQAFEKIAKGYYILIGRLEPEEAAGHTFILERLKKEIHEEDIQNITQLMSSINEKKFDLKESETTLNILEKNEDDLRIMKEQEIKSIFDFFKVGEENLKSKESMEKLNIKIHERRILRFLKYLILKITHFRIRDSEIKAFIEQAKLESYIDDILISMRLNYFSLVTFLHFNTPRYPFIKKSKINFFDYNQNLGIVKTLPELIKEFEKIDTNIKEQFKQ